MIKHAVCSILTLLIFVCPVAANDLQEVETLLKTKTEAVLQILGQKDAGEADKKHRIMELIEPIIDFQLMAKLTLGKVNWGKLNADEQSEFVGLFVERLKRSYLDKTSFYNDEKVAYQPGVQKGNKVYVPVEITSNEKTIELLYKFYRSNQAWMAYDIEINGVSLVKSYRTQFDEILTSGSVQDLFTELKKKTED